MKRIGLLAAAISLALSAGGAWAQSAALTTSTAGPSAAAVRSFWTPARLARAKPIEKRAAVTLGAAPSLAGAPSGPQISGDGAPPTARGEPANEFLYKVTKEEEENDSGGVAPFATSSTGAFFTTSRVFPDSATVAYPYRATGKLFFHDPRTNEDFICSASVLRPRVIVTAGHCVFHPAPGSANDYFYSNWLFVPAFRQFPPADFIAPYCSWTTNFRIVAGAWSNSNGNVPNAQDVALIQANDKACTSRRPQKLGNVTGYYGYLTNALLPQSITQIGYPRNLDGGLRMEVTWAQSFQSGGSNTVIIGSAQRGGASGGPWLKDFGVSPVDSAAHPAVSRNQVVSVTSYGPISESPQYLGASILDNRFISLLNTICRRQAGNC